MYQNQCDRLVQDSVVRFQFRDQRIDKRPENLVEKSLTGPPHQKVRIALKDTA